MSRNRSRSETDPDPEAEDGKSRGWFLWLPFLFDIKILFCVSSFFCGCLFFKNTNLYFGVGHKKLIFLLLKRHGFRHQTNQAGRGIGAARKFSPNRQGIENDEA